MPLPTPAEIWATTRRARLARVLVVYLSISFVVLQVVSMFTEMLGLPGWFFPGAVALLLIGLPIIVTTALVQSVPAPTSARVPTAPNERPGDAENEGRAESSASVLSVTPGPSSSIDRAPARVGHWLTWQKAILGGLGAFALWGIVVTAYMVMRSAGIGPVGSLVAAGALEARDRVLVADFENRTPDPQLGAAVTEAFRIDLAQSTIVTVVQPEATREVLRRMQRSVDEPLALELAREVAIREGIKAVVAGEISKAGTGFVLTARLLQPETGGALAAFRETAADSTRIIAALDALSKKLREKVGESLKSIRGNEPLEQVTTSSLEALRRYSQGVRAYDLEANTARAVPLLEEAVALDSAFAMGWRKLGVALQVAGVPRSRQLDAFARAYRYRERLTAFEKYMTEAEYHQNVTGNFQSAIAAYESLLESHPREIGPLVNLGIAYIREGEYERAEAVLRSIELKDVFFATYIFLAVATASQGKLDETRAALDSAAARGEPLTPLFRSHLAALQGNWAEAETHARAGLQARNLAFQEQARLQLAHLAAVRGRLAEAENWLHDAVRVARELGRPADQLSMGNPFGAPITGGAVGLGLLDVLVRMNPARGVQTVQHALEQVPLDSLPVLDRPYFALAYFFGAAGGADVGRHLLLDFETEVPPEYRRGFVGRHRAAGAVALGRGLV
ncbi:MAG: tetratricopeptide repeat protein, partial [Gemmatimonadetes bacterium]|nr:tetratricopeptide repeat protein [Gemmatimonadota bacterium]